MSDGATVRARLPHTNQAWWQSLMLLPAEPFAQAIWEWRTERWVLR